MAERKEKIAGDVHTSVLLQEVIDGLSLKKGDIVLDATVNGGGHSEKIAKEIGKNGKILGIDMDADALLVAKEKLADAEPEILLHEGNFRNLDKALKEYELTYINGAIFDLGISSRQLEDSERGFSFKGDEPLMMTLKKDVYEGDITAEIILNTWSEELISNVIFGYSEERYARAIAKEIVKRREIEPFKNTKQLVEAVISATPIWYSRGKIHPATKTFQAMRIAVNDEIEALQEALNKLPKVFQHGGRVAVISFHSIEDRVCKTTFKMWQTEQSLGKIITKKPIVASKEEKKENLG